MRLYSRDGATAVSHGGETYTPGDDGGFDFPEDVGREQHAFHAGKVPLWETDIERQERLLAEEMGRRKDPATLLDAVNQLVAAAQAVAPVSATPAPETPARPARSRAKGAPAAS